MRVFVVVNHVREIGFRQTTTLLINAFDRQGDDVYLVDVDGLHFSDTPLPEATNSPISVDAIGLPSRPTEKPSAKTKVTEVDVESLQAIEDFASNITDDDFDRVELAKGDLVLIRTNPGRDAGRAQVHQTFLELCQLAQALGVTIINTPHRLAFFASKAAIALLPPDQRPVMRISDRLTDISAFIESANVECVVKPLVGSRGENVIRLSSTMDSMAIPSENLSEKLSQEQTPDSLPTTIASQLAQTYREEVPLVVQHYVASDEPGDKRVVVLDGLILEREGHVAGIHRLPAKGDFRANLHAGGSAHPLTLTSPQREAVEAAAKLLAANGIRLAGVDLVGDKVIEFNVFSTGGLFDSIQFSNVDFAQIIAKRLSSPSG